ncbi:MAG: SCP2 sterol-binding domain-containing protein [Oxalobacter formigenes]|nr:SCP2 sterol-binding domain-containing protein [Oxalobacter formigenes]
MKLKPFKVPDWLGKAFSLATSYPGSVLFASAANMLLESAITEEMQAMLAGKLLRLTVTDMGLHFNFLWAGNGFVAGRHVEKPDLVISACAHDFMLLALQKEDADTLFFSRRLVMEGDTELGVLLKNTIDALEPDIYTLVKNMPGRLLAALLRKS